MGKTSRGESKNHTVVCPSCGARLRVREDRLDTPVACLECRFNFRARTDYESQLRDLHDNEETNGGDCAVYSLEAAEPRRQPRMGTDVRSLARMDEPSPLPPKPRWVFFSGVFSFPWYRGTLVRWAVIAACLTIGAEILLFGYHFGGSLGVAFMGLAVIAVWAWALCYGAAQFLAIVEDTATGYDAIQNWPEFDLGQWIVSCLSLGYLAALAAAVGYGVDLLTGATGAGLAGALFLLLPLLVLSALEGDAIVLPVSPPVLRSLIDTLAGWLVFYLETGALAALLLLLVPLFGWNDYVAALAAGPAVAAGVIIYARLLGRLGWLAVVRRKKRKRKKLVASVPARAARS